MKISAIVQARIGSTRLPGKVMMEIGGKPMLWYSVKRLQAVKSVDNVIVATTTEKRDDVIYNFCKEHNIECYRGSENDVLDRYYQTAKKIKSDIILRVTSDCPLIDPEIVEMALQEFLKNKFNYIRTGKSWPNGVGTVEILDFKTLEYVWRNAKEPGEREHVTPYIYTHPEKFKIQVIECGKNYEGVVLSVDTKPQFDAVKKIIGNLGRKNENFGMEEILSYLDKNPGILKSLQHMERRGPEHYLKSIGKEK